MTDFTAEELAERTYDHLNQYIVLADRKASILLTGQFAFLGLGATAITNISTRTGNLFQILTVLTGVIGMVAVVLAIAVVYPRDPSPETGFIYWRDILEHELGNSYHAEITELDAEDALETLTKENYALAKVADTKYCFLRWSLQATLVMVGSAAVTVTVSLIQ